MVFDAFEITGILYNSDKKRNVQKKDFRNQASLYIVDLPSRVYFLPPICQGQATCGKPPP